MEGIVLTKTAKTKLYSLINKFYNDGSHSSFDNFKQAEKRNIVLMPILNDLHVLSPSFLVDKGYIELRKFILSNIKLPVRTIKPSEMPKIELEK